ncbi:MAG: hypothetical protein HY980_01270 [Candidatus Magasanikbacteria bacterium]|nr:hypothetical protein [Candidatus Magasanikbacteria bacterium]
MPTQPTILVKKSDGTFARMSWDEFNVYRTQNTINKTQPTSVETPKAEVPASPAGRRSPNADLPAKEGEVLPATATPVKEVFVDEAKYVRTYEKDAKLRTTKVTNVEPVRMQNTRLPEPKAQADGGQADNRKQIANEVKAWTKDDIGSLLDQPIDGAAKTKAVNVLPDKRDDLYSLLIKEIRFPVKDEMRGRLNSLAVSLVKGVRTEEQVEGYLKRDAAECGLGFSEAQAGAVIAAVKKVWHLALRAEVADGSVGVSRTHPSPLSERGNLRFPTKSEYQKLPPRRRAGEVLGINAKPLVQDVMPPKIEPTEKVSLGPVDEIATMTLLDFRRLATGGTDSVHVLRDKFSALRKESVIIYLQALDAWFSSPLYRDYQGLIRRAVNERRKLQEVVGESGVKWEEFVKLAGVGRG